MVKWHLGNVNKHFSALKCHFATAHPTTNIGYHYYITRDGTIHEGRPLDQNGAGV